MAPAIIDLDVSKIESPILRFQEFRTLAAKPGFFWRFVQRTNEPPKTQQNPLYVQYIPLIPLFSLFYSTISILPLYTLVGWTDSQNKLKESELACPPTKNHGGHSVDKSPLVGQDFFILSTLMSTEGRSAAAPWTRFRSSSKGRKMAKSRNRNRARTARSAT